MTEKQKLMLDLINQAKECCYKIDSLLNSVDERLASNKLESTETI